jgi:hypothetical protein
MKRPPTRKIFPQGTGSSSACKDTTAASRHQRRKRSGTNAPGTCAVYSLLSAVCYLQSTVCCLLSAVCCLLSTVYCLLSTVYCLLFTVYCLLFTVSCPKPKRLSLPTPPSLHPQCSPTRMDKTPQEREKLAKELFTDYSQVHIAILSVRLSLYLSVRLLSLFFFSLSISFLLLYFLPVFVFAGVSICLSVCVRS